MFCPKCGKENADGSAFCGSCGAELKQPTASNTSSDAVNTSDDAKAKSSETTASSQAVDVASTSASTGKKNKKPLLIGLIVAIVIVVIAIVVGVTTCTKSPALEEGNYSAVVKPKSSSETITYTMSVGEDNTITLSYNYASRYSNRPTESLSGTYEFVTSSNGNDVYAIKDIKLASGAFATLKDTADIFGGASGNDSTLESIEMVVPSGYKEGNMQGNWGFVKVVNHDGQRYGQGLLGTISEDGTGSIGSFYQQDGEAVEDCLTTPVTNGTNTLKWNMAAPGRYNVSAYYDGSMSYTMDITLPVNQ